MRTTLDVDRKLLDEVVEVTGERSKSAAVNRVLEEFVRRTKINELRAMAGTVHLDDTRAEQREADSRREAFLDKLRDG
jgi:Arc/MetJ family transcription regulator